MVEEDLYLKDNKRFNVHHFYPFDSSTDISLQQAYEDLYDLFLGEYLAFADDFGGWQHIISLKKEDYGKVYFCRMDMEIPEALTLLADDFEEFINGLEKPPYE